MKIKLNKKQIKYAIDLATKRHDSKNKSFRSKGTLINLDEKGFKDIDKQYLPHLIGVIGELAWSIATGQKVDESIYSVRDPGQDFHETEIKTITYFGDGEPELKIKVSEYESKIPKLYVLVRFDMVKTVEILGTITREAFDLVKKKKKYGAGKPMNYIAPISKMEIYK